MSEKTEDQNEVDPIENPETFNKILDKLKSLNIQYVHTHHHPVKTSQEAAVKFLNTSNLGVKDP